MVADREAVGVSHSQANPMQRGGASSAAQAEGQRHETTSHDKYSVAHNGNGSNFHSQESMSDFEMCEAPSSSHQTSSVSTASRQEEEERDSGQVSRSSGGIDSSQHAAECQHTDLAQSEGDTAAAKQPSSQQDITEDIQERSLVDGAQSRQSSSSAGGKANRGGESTPQVDRPDAVVETSHERNRQDGQARSGTDEVAGALQEEEEVAAASKEEEDRTGSESRDAKDPRLWTDQSVLQCLRDSPGISAEAWGDRLKLPNDFTFISEDQENCLVMAACKSNGNMLPLFRAYAPHDVLRFMRFAWLHCIQT